ncbi:PsiF family protein [Paraburkholderia hayleyella]|uniref:PsiF family protein n=1 Tax=Paraburkholderia hayleyella TaxID=2152889 RepID=UPI0012908D83|nr:PsiF family protein [Paraburkholderia hayleyella]
MKIQSVVAALILGGILLAPAFAENSQSGQNSQQSKMTTCNHQASGKTGDERKAFMKACLSAAPVPAAAHMTQQEKMKACNTQASGKTGDSRKAFMKSCLSNNG